MENEKMVDIFHKNRMAQTWAVWLLVIKERNKHSCSPLSTVQYGFQSEKRGVRPFMPKCSK